MRSASRVSDDSLENKLGVHLIGNLVSNDLRPILLVPPTNVELLPTIHGVDAKRTLG